MNVKSILVATDFSKCSVSAFEYASFLAKVFSAKMIVLHVIDQRHAEKIREIYEQSENDVKKRLSKRSKKEMDDFLKKCNKEIVEIDTIISWGIPFQEIALKGRELAVDLVVMGGYGRRGKGQIDEIFFGGTAEKVVRLLPCPVLCVPMGG
jgi:nucleotide-binding universal stress UspA family protein